MGLSGLPAARGFAASFYCPQFIAQSVAIWFTVVRFIDPNLNRSVCPPRRSSGNLRRAVSVWKPCRAKPATLSRRSFLAASAALAARPAGAAARRAVVGPVRGRHRRRRRRRHRRRAPARRRRTALCGDRSDRSYRRPLRHRYQNLRRAVRSRRALDLPARLQSGDQAHAAARHRRLSGAAEPEGAHRPALCARRRARGFPDRPGARHARHRRGGAQSRHSLRAGDAGRSRRLARDDRIRARPV